MQTTEAWTSRVKKEKGMQTSEVYFHQLLILQKKRAEMGRAGLLTGAIHLWDLIRERETNWTDSGS